MSTSSRLGIRLALLGLVATLLACSSEDSPLVTGGRVTRPTTAPSGDTVPTTDPTSKPSATPSPTLQSLLISPSEVSLSSDPAADPLSRGINLAAIAVLSDNSQVSADVTWSASPAGLVTVNTEGYVRAVTNAPSGTATVTASTGSIQATATVHVTARPLTVKSVSLASTGLTLYTPAEDGDNTAGLPTSAQLVAVVTMSDDSTSSAVTWSSSNDQVAQVSGSGRVTSVGAGNATLTVKAAQDPLQSASCPITVKAQGLVDVTVE